MSTAKLPDFLDRPDPSVRQHHAVRREGPLARWRPCTSAACGPWVAYGHGAPASRCMITWTGSGPIAGRRSTGRASWRRSGNMNAAS